MAINRFSLIRAISNARRLKDDDLYDELLKIYYRLLEQEEINDDFMVEFTMYGTVSDSAQELLSKCLVATPG